MPASLKIPLPEVVADPSPIGTESAPNTEAQKQALSTDSERKLHSQQQSAQQRISTYRTPLVAWMASYQALSVLLGLRAAMLMLDALKDERQSASLPATTAINYLNENAVVSVLLYGWWIVAILIGLSLISSAIYFYGKRQSAKWPNYVLGEVFVSGAGMIAIACPTFMLWTATGAWTTEIGREIFVLLWIPIVIVATWAKANAANQWRDWVDGVTVSGGNYAAPQTTVAHSHWTDPRHRWFHDITEDEGTP